MPDVPKNTNGRKGKGKKPTKKKEFSLADFKKGHGLEDVRDVPLDWYELSPAIKEQLGLPGFPKGYASTCRGHSNTGKSTALCEGIVAAQKKGDLPIIIDLETNIGKERLTLMGFDWDGDYIFVDRDFLLNTFGKPIDKNRTQASIEDLAKCFYYFTALQAEGKLPYDLCFAIDSFGTLNCNMTIKAVDADTNQNNQWNAGAMKVFSDILYADIPLSRKVSSPYTNTLISVQKIWIETVMNNKVVKHKHGDHFFYGTRLIIHFGGVVTHGTKTVKATSKGNKVAYGIESKMKVVKNQVDGEYGGISLEESLITSTPHGFIASTKEAEAAYKKEHLAYFRRTLKDENLIVDEIGTEKIEIIKIDDNSSNDGSDVSASAINNLAEKFNKKDDDDDDDDDDLNVDTETGEILD
jgi:hypothetical protein